MMARMRRAGHYFQIGIVVICPSFVLVMDNLIAFKPATQLFFGNHAMKSSALIRASRNLDIAVWFQTHSLGASFPVRYSRGPHIVFPLLREYARLTS